MGKQSSTPITFLLRLASAAAFIGTMAVTVDVHAQDIERGRTLYENHCQRCHTAKVHGRKDRTAMSVDDLREIVGRWQNNEGLRWRNDEIEDVVQYLARTRYFFTTHRE
jgi:mono/diheme cytochrome c family protein